ncbi:MAG: hypothetical protein JXQ80_07815 [Bacteroidales bacterium]|nr:hypothetical protein [Bacteroidales bacterium]
MNNLYTVPSFEVSLSKDKVTARISLNRGHNIFEGHFPGNPILPGVCTVQIALELLEKLTGRELRLAKAGNIKYLGFVNPITTPDLIFELAIAQAGESNIQCSTSVSAGGTRVCTFKGEYENINA